MEPGELRARRAKAQHLSEPAAGAREAVGRLLAVQAQELRWARLAIRARTRGLTAAGVDRELSRGSLVVGWLLRGTLHLVLSEDYRWLLALTAPARLTANRRRLLQEGISVEAAERGVEAVRHALATEGPLTRPELGERLRAEGIRAEGQALPHLLMLAALRGVAVLGPFRHGRSAFALADDWLEPAAPVERDAALAGLARRYLAGHGPATAADLARWAGLPLREARAGFAAASLPAGETPPAPPPRLLPAFDPYLLGWHDRSFAVPPAHARRVHPGGGVLRAVATVRGQVAGTWTLRGGAVELEPFAPLAPDDEAALAAEAADVARFLS
ncbi:MAG TPA: winged helix DNA-binding domain-containing protein [Gaiellaceae bacterium]|nr:winged helix DNA-binding domain-containing protein [Gaiellaceae bacterium]